MTDFICSKCKERQNNIFLVKNLDICWFCAPVTRENKPDFIDKLLNQAYEENQWNDKK